VAGGGDSRRIRRRYHATGVRRCGVDGRDVDDTPPTLSSACPAATSAELRLGYSFGVPRNTCSQLSFLGRG
jgi:hypothetical protein